MLQFVVECITVTKLVECMIVTKLCLSMWVLHFECMNFSVCKCEWVFWFTLQVTDESDNHTINNTIQYWLDCGWVIMRCHD